MRTDLTLTAPEQLVLPQAARRTRIPARRHRPWNITQETQPDAPMKTRPACWIHKYSVFSERLHCACAALGLPVSSSVLQLSLLFLTINFSFILLLNRKISPLTLSSCMLKHYCLKSFRPLWTNWTVIRSLVWRVWVALLSTSHNWFMATVARRWWVVRPLSGCNLFNRLPVCADVHVCVCT